MEETVELRQYLFIVRKWLWLIALSTALAAITAYLVSANFPPTYRASTVLLISEANSPAGATYQDILSSERIARTYAELLQKRPVLQGTAARLGLDESAELTDLPFTIEVQPIRDTQLIELSVESQDPQLAAQVANTVPQVFIQQNEALQTRRFASSKQNLTEQMDSLQADLQRTEETIAQLKASDSTTAPAQISQLESLLAQYRSSYATLLQSYEQIRLAETQSVDNVIVVETAPIPHTPVKPRILLNTLLAATLGAALTVGLAFLMEYMDDTLKSPSDITQALGLPSLGIIPRIPGEQATDRLTTVDHSRSLMSEAYRSLRTNIQFASPDRPLIALLVTSAGPTEGKTLTVANLAVVMAQAGQRVILVDSDLRRPTLHRIFDLPNHVGLTNALFSNEANIEPYLQLTPAADNLRVLTSGPLPPNPSELLGSQRMKDTLERLKHHADVILFDSPPALPVTDAAILTTLVDGTILVADAGVTRRGLAQRAVDSLTRVGGNLLGAALNKVAVSGHGSYYYHYYYDDAGEKHQRRQRRRAGSRLLQRLRTHLPWMNLLSFTQSDDEGGH